MTVKGVPVGGSSISMDEVMRKQFNKLRGRHQDGLVRLVEVNRIARRFENAILGFPTVADGSTAGKLKTTTNFSYRIAGQVYTEVAADDFWDLSGETDTTGAQYRAYLLYINAAGASSFEAGANAASAAAAVALLETLIDDSKAVVGTFVAGLSCDFDDAGGLAAQGTITNGFPAAMSVIASVPAAETLLGDGGTDGKVYLLQPVTYRNGGAIYHKVATDDLWDLSGETNVVADRYRAYALLLDGGVASVLTHTAVGDQTTAALALSELDKVLTVGDAVIGIFVTDGTLCDWDNASGLAAQGTFYSGFPESLAVEDVKQLI